MGKNNIDRLTVILDGVVKLVDKLVDKVEAQEKRIVKLEAGGK